MGLLVECGPSVPEKIVERRIDPLSITDMFISHIHTDHCRGVAKLFEMMIGGAALARGKSHKLRLWGSEYTVSKVVEATRGIIVPSGKKRKNVPLVIQTGVQDDRFRVFKVDHARGSCGLWCRLNSSRIIYFGDTGKNTNFKGIVGSMPSPTTVILEANNGMGPSSSKHLGYEDARSIFKMFKKSGRGTENILWHVRRDRDAVRRQAEKDGIIFV